MGCSIIVNIGTAGGCEIVSKLGDLAGDGVSSLAGSALDSAASSAGKSAGQFVTSALGWWTYSGGVNFDSPVIANATRYTMPITTILLTLGVVVAGAKIALSRNKEPGVNLVVNLIAFLVVSSAGVALFAAIQSGGDSFAKWVIGQTSGDFGKRLAEVAGSGYSSAFGVIIVSLLLIVMAFVQWVLMLFRYAALLVLAIMLPMAASASVAQGKTDSLKRVISWSIGLLLYKPIAALIYAIGFSTIGTAKDLSTLLQGAVVLLLAVVALPSLVKLFSWAGAGAGGGGGAMAAMIGTGAGMAMGRGGGSSGGAAAEQASFMEQTGPGSGGGGGGRGGDVPLGSPPGGGSSSGAPGSASGGPGGTGTAGAPGGAGMAGVGAEAGGASAAGGAAAGGAAAGGAAAGAASGGTLLVAQAAQEGMSKAKAAASDSMPGGSDAGPGE